MAEPKKEAYCTLLMSDDYLPGAMVLAHSLKDNGTKRKLAVLVTLDTLAASTIEELKTVYDHIIPVDLIVNKSPANLYLMQRPDLASTFTKIALWRQNQFEHIVYLDADVVALRAPDELFTQDASFAAVPDIGWPDCFNSGVLSLKPNMGDYYALLALAQRGISFDGADQGLLNTHFRDWERLSFTYNCTPSGHYQYVPAYRHFQSTITMVHYIGHDKPWIVGREAKGATGIYEELLGRWWSVYDKHYRTSTTTYISGQSRPEWRTAQQHVKGKASTNDYGFSSLIPRIEEPEALFNVTELPLTEKTGIQQSEVTPRPFQQRNFSVDWDPIHQPPPANSRPEASNFPSQTYDMSNDLKLFRAPEKYPEAPKDMYYQVPPKPHAAERPKPIFPWEEHQIKPTRVFAEDALVPQLEATPSITTDDDTQDDDTLTPTTPTIQVTAEPFASYSRTNAWDEVPAIERYVSNLAQNRRRKIQVLENSTAMNESGSLAGGTSPSQQQQQQQRRPSMRITDFPTEIERPSLPVTPAPIGRPSFWGQERNASGDLPGAEGVPEQVDWDPTAKLAELQRRQSEVLAQGPTSPTRDLPDRQLPGSAALASIAVESALPSAPDLRAPDFAGRNSARRGENKNVLSPTG